MSIRSIHFRLFEKILLTGTVSVLTGMISSLHAAGVYRDGTSARAMALGGADAATSSGSLDALSGNPAALSDLHAADFQVGAVAGFASGTFRSRVDDVTMHSNGVAPVAAFSIPVGPVHLGFGVAPVAALKADWYYSDAPGGLDGLTSYGERTNRSEIYLLRTALGASVEISKSFSAGASVGLLYNRNQLEAPYVLQSQPVLRGAKVLLDLDTEGYGWDFKAGLLWKPTATFSISASYTTQARIETEGSATVDARRQLRQLGIDPADNNRRTDAEVINTFPQVATLGAAWHVTPKLTVVGQVDWINWADSFDTLEVRLSDSRSSDLNGLTGSTKINDNIPLNWRDQWVWRTGAEYAIDDHWTLRAGYVYAHNPVPDATLTPLTAAISEHTVSAGLGYRSGRATVDLAWQWNLPNKERVGVSGLAGGEYSQSSTEVGVQWVGLTTGWGF